MKLVQINDVGTTLTVVSYLWRGDDFGWVTVPNASISQTAAPTLGWFTASLERECFDQIVRVRQVPGVNLTAYRWGSDQTGFELLKSQDMGSGAAALAWLVADVDGDGRDEIVQVWNNAGTAAFLVYQWTGKAAGWKTSAATTTQTSAANRWFAIDVDGDGMPEIVQVVTVNGNLSMAVYAWDPLTGKIVVRSPVTSVNFSWDGPTIGWYTGVFQRSGRAASVVQVLADPPALWFFEWSPDVGAMVDGHGESMSPPDDTNALAWLVGPPMPGDIPATIQLKAGPKGRLAMVMSQFTEIPWRTDDAGQNASGKLLPADTACAGKLDILQLWGPTLSMALYRWQSLEAGYVGKQFNTTQSWTATNWLVAR